MIRKYFILILLFNFVLSIYSQSIQKLDTIVINNNINNKNLKTIEVFLKNGQTTQILNEYDLNRNNPAFFEQSLNTMSGVQVDKRTQIGGQRIVIRGYGNDQKFNNWGIKLYYNFMPLTTSDGVTILDDIDFSIINNIEVIKGPASTMYGTGVGGVVLLNSNLPKLNGIFVEQNSTIGSFNLMQTSSKINYKNDNSSMFLDYGHIESKGYRPHSNSVKNFYSYNGEFKISSKETIQLLLNSNYSNNKIAGQISYSDYYNGIDNGNSAYIKKNAQNNYNSFRFGILYKNNISKNFDSSTSLFYSNIESENTTAGAYTNGKSPNYGIRSEFNWRKIINESLNNELSFGTEIQYTTSLTSSYRFTGANDSEPLEVNPISRASYFDSKNNQSSYFIQNRLIFEPQKISILFGLSANKTKYNRKDLLAFTGLITEYNKDLSFEKSFDLVFNPHFSIQKKIKDNIFNLSYSIGYNAPTAATSFISQTNETNDDLKPEKAAMIEFSLQGLLYKKLEYQVAIYSMNISNKLTQLSGVIPQGGTYSYWANTGNQENRGIEFSIAYFIDIKNSFLKNIQPFTNFSINRFRYKDFETKIGNDIENYNCKLVVGVPDSKYTLGIDFKLNNGIYFQNTFNKMANVYTDFKNTNSVDGYEQFNSKIGFLKEFFNKRIVLDFFLAGNNVTNKINYTFLFIGNNVNDMDVGSNYPSNVSTDINPGPKNAYFFGGLNLKYNF